MTAYPGAEGRCGSSEPEEKRGRRIQGCTELGEAGPGFAALAQLLSQLQPIWVPLGASLFRFSGTREPLTLRPAESPRAKQGKFILHPVPTQPAGPTRHLVMDLTTANPCCRHP